MRKLLWIGDAVASTGFARCTHKTLEVVERDWDVVVLGLNYFGDPHSYPYKIYPCYPGGDFFGVRRVREIMRLEKPDLIVIQNDPWNIRPYMEMIREESETIPVVGAIAVDGLNCRGTELNLLDACVFWTNFGLNEARAGGFTKPGFVVPLGVDESIYFPRSRQECREQVLGIPELADAFIVGHVARNQPRKRLDLTIRYFCQWLAKSQVQDAYLMLHVAPTGDVGYDLRQLFRYYKERYQLGKRLILSEPDPGKGDPEEKVAAIYGCFDVLFTTTQGEGWGLPVLEAMACGVPAIVPDWSALGDWAAPAAYLVPCTSTSATFNGVNVIGGIMDEGRAIAALDHMYSLPALRERYRKAGIALAARPDYRWPAIGAAFCEALERSWQARIGSTPAVGAAAHG